MKKLMCLVLLSVAILPCAAWANDACDHDRAKVCGGITPGESAVHNCMLANISKLSPDCQNTVQQTERLIQQFMYQCKEDARRFCAVQMELRPNEALDCMRGHKQQFSVDCKRIYKQYKAFNYPAQN